MTVASSFTSLVRKWKLLQNLFANEGELVLRTWQRVATS